MCSWLKWPQQQPDFIATIVVTFMLALPTFVGRSILWDVRDGAVYALLAIGVAYLWRCGLASFGHSLFFGVGAYATALSGVELHLGGIAALAIGVLVGWALAFVLGWIFVYRGLRGPSFTIFTLALVVMAQLLVTGLEITGGDAGLVGKTVRGLGGPSMNTAVNSYYLAVGALLVVVILLSIVLNKGQGVVLEAIRTNEERLQGLGYNTDLILTVVFTMSGGIAAIAGALYASIHTLATPDLIGPTLATEALVWAALGGLGALWRPVVAAFLAWKLQQYFASLDPLLWPLLLGAAIIAIANTRLGKRLPDSELAKQWS